MKKCLVVTLLALALSAGLASAEDLQLKETLQKLMAEPYYKALDPASRGELFQKVLEANSPEFAAISNMELRECLMGLIYRWLDGKSIDNIKCDTRESIIERYSPKNSAPARPPTSSLPLHSK